MIDRPPLSFWHPTVLLATWFGCGLLRPAPGTIGSLAALPFAAAILWIGGAWFLFLASLLMFFIGIPASDNYERLSGRKDPGSVVLDEVAGQWLTLVPLSLSLEAFAIGFLLFRAFDIGKIWPANLVERRFGGGLGIMADDMIAGLYAGAMSYALLLGFA